MWRAARGISADVAQSSSIWGDRLRLGIASRLVIAFAGVGTLVLAANFIVEKGVLIERTTEITRTLPAPVPAPPVAAQTPAAAIEPPPAVVPERRIVAAESLTLALDGWGEALRKRARANDDVTDSRYRKTVADLRHADAEFTTTAAAITGKSFARLDAAVKAAVQSGDHWVELADQRRTLMQQYVTVFERLNARDEASISRSWKMFGRVLAKQSLLQLGTDLDSLRRHALAFNANEDADDDSMAAWQTAEDTVIKNVADHKAGLQRSEGTAWLDAMQTDFGALATLHRAIADLGSAANRVSEEVQEHAALLPKLIPLKLEAAPLPVPRKPIAASSPPPASLPAPALPAPALPAPAPVASAATAASAASPAPAAPWVVAAVNPTAPTIATHQTWHESPEAHRRRLVIAWISAGAVLLLFYMALGTVLSFVRPVRRLVRAAAQLAAGDTSARVERGGIAELDRVAVAFNAMAGELAIARAATRASSNGWSTCCEFIGCRRAASKSSSPNPCCRPGPAPGALGQRH